MFRKLAILAAALVVGMTATAGSAWDSMPPEECDPREAHTEVTDWVLESPGEGWYQVDERTVVDVEGVTGVDQWYHWNGGNEETPPPPPPAAGWNTDQGNHEGLKNKPDYAPNTVFDASVLGGDNASWFYHEFTEEVEEVSHQEYKFAFDHPAVICDEPDYPGYPDVPDANGNPDVPKANGNKTPDVPKANGTVPHTV